MIIPNKGHYSYVYRNTVFYSQVLLNMKKVYGLGGWRDRMGCITAREKSL
jgi:hypothetical protein